jgi:hypothetical protein
MKRILLLLLALLPALFARAQRHHEVGVMAGVSAYYGDLQHEYIPNTKLMKPSAGIIYKYFFNPHLGIRAAASYINLSAADSLSPNRADQLRNLDFTNHMLEVQVGLELNIFPIDIEKAKFTPFLFAGIAGTYGNPFTRDINNEKFHLRNLSTEGQGLPGYPDRKLYSLVNASFPLGGGFKAYIGKTVLLTAEIGLRYAATDYLDDVSRSYVNLDTLRAYKGDKAVELSYRGNEVHDWDGNYPNHKFQRGDFKKNDWYWTAGVSATVYFDAFGNAKTWLQTKCPRIFGRR